MDTQHRKIELQSPQDLTYVATRLRSAARQKLDLHLPPVSTSSATEPDELRQSVEQLVDAFVAQLLGGMRANISINGLDVVPASSISSSSSSSEGAAVDGDAAVVPTRDGDGDGDGAAEKHEYEAFDEKLRVRLGAAVARRDALVAQISQHRRSTPFVAARAWEERWRVDGEALGTGEEDGIRRAAAVGVLEEEGVEGMERAGEVERNWERAVEGLARLNKGLPETRARLERCGDVVGYLDGGRD
ncbi:hypothetical protein ACN47E_003736 [Coniothyrium glycines]